MMISGLQRSARRKGVSSGTMCMLGGALLLAACFLVAKVLLDSPSRLPDHPQMHAFHGFSALRSSELTPTQANIFPSKVVPVPLTQNASVTHDTSEPHPITLVTIPPTLMHRDPPAFIGEEQLNAVHNSAVDSVAPLEDTQQPESETQDSEVPYTFENTEVDLHVGHMATEGHHFSSRGVVLAKPREDQASSSAYINSEDVGDVFLGREFKFSDIADEVAIDVHPAGTDTARFVAMDDVLVHIPDDSPINTAAPVDTNAAIEYHLRGSSAIEEVPVSRLSTVKSSVDGLQTFAPLGNVVLNDHLTQIDVDVHTPNSPAPLPLGEVVGTPSEISGTGTDTPPLTLPDVNDVNNGTITPPGERFLDKLDVNKVDHFSDAFLDDADDVVSDSGSDPARFVPHVSPADKDGDQLHLDEPAIILPAQCHAVANAAFDHDSIDWSPIPRQVGKYTVEESGAYCCAACAEDDECVMWKWCSRQDGCDEAGDSRFGDCHAGSVGYSLKLQINPFDILASIRSGEKWTTGLSTESWLRLKQDAIDIEEGRLPNTAAMSPQQVLSHRHALKEDPFLPLIYLDVSVHGESIGRMEFALYEDWSPRATRNFLAMCSGEKGVVPEGHTGAGLKYEWKGSPFYRIVYNYVMQAGAFTDAATSPKSYFKDDRDGLHQLHDRAGLLTMANWGVDMNDSHFMITMAAAPLLDHRHVIFGELVSGWGVARVMNGLAKYDNPTSHGEVGDAMEVFIESCGRLRGP